MNIKKPNSFARYGNDYVAPLTTIDQIVKPSGERYTDKEFELMSNVENVMFGENGAGKNLLNPTLQTTTQNGVTCTNNGDGTYTLNGTNNSSNELVFWLTEELLLAKGTYKILGAPNVNGVVYLGGTFASSVVYEGKTVSTDGGTYSVAICFAPNASISNAVIKPMITEDLNATYDDFEPYVKSLKQLTNSALNIDLLWTNASTTSAFAPQTISLDLNNYKCVLVHGKRVTSENAYYTGITIVNSSGVLLEPSTDVLLYRRYTTSNNSITFEIGRLVGGTDTNENWAIPVDIYGIK